MIDIPLPNEHAARIKDPGNYPQKRDQNDKFGPGISVVWGITKDGTPEIQSIHFDDSKFTPKQAEKWLKEHDYTPIIFEPSVASEQKMEAADNVEAKITAPSIEYDDERGTATIKGQAILSVGIYKGEAFSTDDLQNAAANYELLKDHHQVPARLGHEDENGVNYGNMSGAPAVGWAKNLRCEGPVLLADFDDVPYQVALGIERGAWKTKSSEIEPDIALEYNDGTGKIVGPVIMGVAFLGADIPAVPDLNNLGSLYETGKGSPKATPITRQASMCLSRVVKLFSPRLKFSIQEGGTSNMPEDVTKVAETALAENAPEVKPAEEKPKPTVEEALSELSGLAQSLPALMADTSKADEYKVTCSRVQELMGYLGEVLPKDNEETMTKFSALVAAFKASGVDMSKFEAKPVETVPATPAAEAPKIDVNAAEMNRTLAKLQADNSDTLAKLAAAELANKKQAALIAELQKEAEAKKASAALEFAQTFTGKMKDAGKLAPVDEPEIQTLILSMRAEPKTLKFSQGEKTVEKTPFDIFEAYVAKMPANSIINLSNTATTKEAPAIDKSTAMIEENKKAHPEKYGKSKK